MTQLLCDQGPLERKSCEIKAQRGGGSGKGGFQIQTVQSLKHQHNQP